MAGSSGCNRDHGWPSKPKTFTIWSFTENVCNSPFQQKILSLRALSRLVPTLISQMSPPPPPSILAAQASFLRPSPPPGTPSGTWLSFMTQIRLQTPLFQAAFVDHPSGANFLHFPGHHSVIFFLEFSTTSKPLISLFTSFLSCTKARLCVSVHQCSPGQYRPGP